MKKLITLLYLLLLCISSYKVIFASNSYARITANYAYLYKTASTEIQDNVICYLEQSYFVEITLDYNSEFYKVNYNGITGYALKNNLTKVIGTPSKPYPTTNIVSIDNKCYLRNSPKISQDNIITIIPNNCQDLNYIGYIYGEEAIDYQGNLWYYVNFLGVNGYIYSKYISSINPIALNSENLDTNITNLNAYPSPLNNLECGMIIFILSLPISIIIIIMYKAQKPTKTKKITRKIPKVKTKDPDELL